MLISPVGIVIPLLQLWCFPKEVPMARVATTFAFLTLLVSNLQADEADKPTFGKVFFPDSIRFVTATSEDQEVATLLFDNFVLSTSNGKGDLVESRTKSFSVANKIESKDAVSVTIDIRGFVSTAEAGSAALVVQAGGETTVVDIEKAITAATSKPRDTEVATYVAAVESSKAAGFTVSSRPKESEDYMIRIPVKLAKGQPLQATVLLLVDRLPETGSMAMITVDSIDTTIKADSAPKKKTEQPAETAKADKKRTESAEEKVPAAKKDSKKPDGDEKVASEKSTEKKSADSKTTDDKVTEKKSDSKKSSEDKKSDK